MVPVRAFAAGALAAALLATAFWITSDLDLAPELIRRGFLLALAVASLPALIANRQALSGVPQWAWALLLADLSLRALSASLALDPLSAWIGGSERGLGWLDALAWSLIALLAAQWFGRSGHALRSSVRIALLAAIGLSAIALLQVCLSWRHAAADLPLLRPGATLGNPNFLAGVLAVALPAWISIRQQRWTKVIGAGLILSALLLTQSRAGLLAGLLGGGLSLLLSIEWTRRALLAAAAVLLAAALTLGWLGTQISRPDSVAIRLALYRAAVDSAWHPLALVDIDGHSDPSRTLRPWIGYGQDNIEAVLTRHRDPVLNRYESHGWDRLADRSHNRLLDRWIECGALGALLGLALGCLPLLRGLRSWQRTQAARDSAARHWRVGIAAASGVWLAYGIDGMFGVPNAALDLAGALAFGVLIAPRPDTRTVALESTPSGGRSWPIWLLGFAWVIALGPIAVDGHRRWLPPLPAEPVGIPSLDSLFAHRRYSVLPSLYALEQLQRQDPQLATPGLDLERWLKLAEHAVRAAPTLPRAWHLLGWMRQGSGDASSARQAYLRALALLDQAQSMERPEWTEALALLARADRTQPTDPVAAQQLLSLARNRLEQIPDAARDAAWYRSYAYLRARQGTYEEAIRAYRQALVLNPADTASRDNLERLQAAL
ncbi:MAG: hypothetical protein KDI66_14090, partial [Xanthomonadales bacterium]|nr:hypothetical protein [Xanthomonadales bacterium]